MRNGGFTKLRTNVQTFSRGRSDTRRSLVSGWPFGWTMKRKRTISSGKPAARPMQSYASPRKHRRTA